MLKSIANWSRKAELRANIKLIVHDLRLPMSVNSMSDIVLASTFANHIALSGGFDEKDLEIKEIAHGIIACSVAEILLLEFDIEPQRVAFFIKSIMDSHNKLDKEADRLKWNKLVVAYWNTAIKEGMTKDVKLIAGDYISNKDRIEMECRVRDVKRKIGSLRV